NPAELAAGAGCGGCHLAEQPMMGPSWQAIADRYGDQEGVESTLLEHMRSGSQGVWGEAPMPPVTPEQLTDDQLSAVLDWVLNR
ncbi:MAG: c-type cytochrome, partial [Chromatocurvus sp.]